MKTLLLAAALLGSFVATTLAKEKQKTTQKGSVQAQYNPKELGVDKSVPWQKTKGPVSKQYNPKEIGIDKSVPRQKTGRR